jgi:hypothetical protein
MKSTSRILPPLALLASMLCVDVVHAQFYDADALAWISTPDSRRMSAARVREITLLRAAREAERRGYTHFEIIAPDGYPARGSVAARHDMPQNVYGNASQSIYPPDLRDGPIRPRSTILVRFCNEALGACRGQRAHRIMLNLRPDGGGD